VSATDGPLRALRREAADRTLFAPRDLRATLERLGFVQADPIRAPARAQDLILRQRVQGYRAGDLERAYPSLPLVEDMVHVYGFVHRAHRPLLHPRHIKRRFNVEVEHPHLRRAVLDYLAAAGPSHPRAVEQAIAERHPRAAIVNAWGGQSNATTHMLDILQYRGLLHVERRASGIRIYALATKRDDEPTLTPKQRADGLIELLVRLYGPVPKASLMQLTLMLGERAMARDALRARIPLLVRRGRIDTSRVDGVEYFRPVDPVTTALGAEPRVRFLAPFDPLVWDRRRFELLWGWTYRFEAYTPLAKRKLGYYALPLLFDDGTDPRVIGWVNVTRSARGRALVRPGYAVPKPRGLPFRHAFDAEVAALEKFLAKAAPEDVAPVE
jgi:uncharacterized protein YcaQ